MGLDELDLSPRHGDEGRDGAHTAGGSRRAGRRPVVAAVLVLLVAAAGVVVFRGLTDAALYYYNADEAVERRAELGDDRIRVQGTVEPGARADDGDVVFTIAFEGASMAVRHRGDPPDLFQPGIPVVLEGRWVGEEFSSDRMLIKHSSEYKADNPDRVPGGAP